jgi:hypothetical protein
LSGRLRDPASIRCSATRANSVHDEDESRQLRGHVPAEHVDKRRNTRPPVTPGRRAQGRRSRNGPSRGAHRQTVDTNARQLIAATGRTASLPPRLIRATKCLKTGGGASGQDRTTALCRRQCRRPFSSTLFAPRPVISQRSRRAAIDVDNGALNEVSLGRRQVCYQRADFRRLTDSGGTVG